MPENTMHILLAIVAAYIVILTIEFSYEETYETRGRSAEGPGGYLDHEEDIRRTISSDGVHVIQIPLAIRQQEAIKRGYGPESSFFPTR